MGTDEARSTNKSAKGEELLTGKAAIGWPVRLVAAILGLSALAFIPVVYLNKGLKDWYIVAAPVIAGIFVWVAVTGRSPGWLERSWSHDKRKE